MNADAARRLYAQYSIARALAESENVAAAAPKILEAVCDSLGWELGALWLEDSNVQGLICWDVWHRPSVHAAEFESLTREVAFPADIGLPGRVWSSGEPWWIPDVAADPNFPRAAAAAEAGLHSAFGLPIRCNGEILGVAEFFSREIRIPDDTLLDMAVAAGNQIGQFVARRKAEEALRESGRRVSETLESITDGFIGLDREWRLTYVNSRAEALFGRMQRTGDDVLGKNIWDEFPDIAATIGYDELRTAMEERVQVDYDRPIPAFDGWFEITAYPSKDGLSVYIRDISRRKRAERALGEAEERYRNIFENAVFGVFQTTADGRFISANAAMARILGYASPEELVATISDIRTQVHADPARRDEFAAVLERDGAVQGFEAQAYRKDGGLIWLSLTGRAVRDDMGALLHFEGMVEDVTERRRAEEALRTSEEQAERARQRVWLLAEASAILSASLDYEDTMARLAQLSVNHLADWCAIDVLDEGGTIRRIAVLHPDPAKMELAAALQERYPPPAEGQRGVSHVIRSGKSEFYREITDDLLREATVDPEHLEIMRGLGISSAISAPILGFGRVLGAITLVAESSRRQYDEDDLALAEDLGRRAGVAIENARLYGSEQRARAAAEDSKAIAQETQARFWFLAEASANLSASLDYETTMNRVTSFAVPFLADCCSVHVFPTGTTPARSTVTHRDPAKEDLVRDLHRHYPPREGDDHPILTLIESHEPVIVSEISDGDMRKTVRDESHLKLLQELGFVSYMAVPLIARSRLFGAVTFASATPERRYDKTHLALAEELAGRAALALDNARLYEESQQVQEALRVAGEAKDEFLGMMSHELRTPITAIYGGSRLLRARGARLDEEKKSAIMFDIEHEAERLFRMVENLMVLSRLELGQEVTTEPVMAQRVTERAVSQFRDRRPGREITFDFDSDTPPVAAQSAYLELILRNLLSNADKYSPAGSLIELKMKRGAGEIEIAVGDRGPGVTEEEEETIFDRFYRSERTSGRASGIGMGLTVCKRLIETQSGRVWARRREGGGFEITFTLPYYKEELG